MFKQTFVLGLFLVVTLVGYSAVEAGKDKPVWTKKKDNNPENWCCYKNLSAYASADGFGDVLFKSLLRPERLLNNKTICPPKVQNPVLTNVVTCLDECIKKEGDPVSLQGKYAGWLLKAFKFTLLICEKNFTEASDHLYKIAQDKVVKHECTTEVSHMLSNLNLDPSSLDNFKQSCVDRDESLTCIKEHHVKNEGLVNDTTLYLQGLLATFYYILEAKVIADGTPHDHSDDKDVVKCLKEMEDTMDYLQDKVDVPTDVVPETEPTAKPEPVTIASTTIVSSTEPPTTASQSTDVSGPSTTTIAKPTVHIEVSPDNVSGTVTPSNDTNPNATTAAKPNVKPNPAQPTKGPDGNNNSTGNSGISIKCFHGFDRLPILAAALAVVVRMALAVAVDGS